MAIQPDNADTKVSLAYVEFEWKADTRPLHQAIDEIRAKNPAELQSVADNWLRCALEERDPVAASNALAGLGENRYGTETVKFNSRFMEGLIARMMKDDEKARSAFSAARLFGIHRAEIRVLKIWSPRLRRS